MSNPNATCSDGVLDYISQETCPKLFLAIWVPRASETYKANHNIIVLAIKKFVIRLTKKVLSEQEKHVGSSAASS